MLLREEYLELLLHRYQKGFRVVLDPAVGHGAYDLLASADKTCEGVWVREYSLVKWADEGVTVAGVQSFARCVVQTSSELFHDNGRGSLALGVITGVLVSPRRVSPEVQRFARGFRFARGSLAKGERYSLHLVVTDLERSQAWSNTRRKPPMVLQVFLPAVPVKGVAPGD